MHDLMFCGPHLQLAYLFYDAYALGMVRVINKAVSDWLNEKEETQETVNRYLQVKMRFAFSDLRRCTNFATRCTHHLEALHPGRELFNTDRVESSPKFKHGEAYTMTNIREWLVLKHRYKCRSPSATRIQSMLYFFIFPLDFCFFNLNIFVVDVFSLACHMFFICFLLLLHAASFAACL